MKVCGAPKIKRTFCEIEKPKGLWKEPNQWIVSVMQYSGTKSIIIENKFGIRFWKQVPNKICQDILEIEAKVKEMLYDERKSVIKVKRVRDPFAKLEPVHKRHLPYVPSYYQVAKVNVVGVERMVKKLAYAEDVLSIFTNKAGEGLSAEEISGFSQAPRRELELIIEGKLESLLTKILDREISGPKYGVEEK